MAILPRHRRQHRVEQAYLLPALRVECRERVGEAQEVGAAILIGLQKCARSTLVIRAVSDRVRQPPLPARQWVLSVPKRLRYLLQGLRRCLTAPVQLARIGDARLQRADVSQTGSSVRPSAYPLVM